MHKNIINFIINESGATSIEYGLIASLIALGLFAAVRAIGTKLSSTFETIQGNL